MTFVVYLRKYDDKRPAPGELREAVRESVADRESPSELRFDVLGDYLVRRQRPEDGLLSAREFVGLVGRQLVPDEGEPILMEVVETDAITATPRRVVRLDATGEGRADRLGPDQLRTRLLFPTDRAVPPLAVVPGGVVGVHRQFFDRNGDTLRHRATLANAGPLRWGSYLQVGHGDATDGPSGTELLLYREKSD